MSPTQGGGFTREFAQRQQNSATLPEVDCRSIMQKCPVQANEATHSKDVYGEISVTAASQASLTYLKKADIHM